MQHSINSTREPTMKMTRRIAYGMAALFLGSVSALSFAKKDPLQTAIDHPDRTAAFKLRDTSRNPYETLQFFEVEPHHKVLEIWPGAGWYSEILAPYLKDDGLHIAGHFNPKSEVAYFVKSLENYKQKLDDKKAIYGKVKLSVFDPKNPTLGIIDESLDRVLTFRNVHNFYMNGGGDAQVKAAFEAMFAALKSGGILGVVDHRLPSTSPREQQNNSGYMHETYVIEMAESVGFKLVEKSEINANPKDTTNHPKGVWSLPPSYALGDENKEKYSAIGESDRMTLKFKKP